MDIIFFVYCFLYELSKTRLNNLMRYNLYYIFTLKKMFVYTHIRLLCTDDQRREDAECWWSPSSTDSRRNKSVVIHMSSTSDWHSSVGSNQSPNTVPFFYTSWWHKLFQGHYYTAVDSLHDRGNGKEGCSNENLFQQCRCMFFIAVSFCLCIQWVQIFWIAIKIQKYKSH